MILFVAFAWSSLSAEAAGTGAPDAPRGPITIIAPFPPGGPVDQLARLLAQGLTLRLQRPVVVENLSGGAGNIGMEKVRRAKADGSTLLVVPAGNLTINPTLMPDFPFVIGRDFAPITRLATAPNVLVAAKGSALRDARDLVNKANARPTGFSYASPGIGSGLHLAGELFKQQTGIEMLHVPYRGTGPALNDVLAGAVPLMFANLPGVLPYVRDGRLIALGVAEAQRSPLAPTIPTFVEQGIDGVLVTSWYGLLAPGATPPETVARLAADAAQILSEPGVGERLAAQGMTSAIDSPDAFRVLIRNEAAQWARVIETRRIVAE